MKKYRAGIDIGSTTVKLVILDDTDNIIFGKYKRHGAHTQETLCELLKEAKSTAGACELNVTITGSGSINLGKALGIDFVQEVVAVATALKKVAPQTDVAIELGGEDAKIIYFSGGLEERMNGVCAGGTGSFIDQMAALLQTDAMGLNKAAEEYQQIYPIAARCGVFAKTDIQPLINEGATKADLAASIFQAVVNQTISGLACGKPIRGCVISLNANGMEKNEGFHWSVGLLADAAKAIVYGDLFMRCLYRVRPYEKVPGSANELHKKWQEICIDSLTNPKTKYTYKAVCRGIVEAFDSFPIDETIRKPRVGVVGEILVKYMPLANNHLVDLLEREGAEAVVPDLIDFFNYSVVGSQYKAEFLGAKKSAAFVSKATIRFIEALRKPATDALRASKRFDAPVSIYKIAEMTKPFLSLGNQYGEGWFLAGEMVELITHGTPNIVCIQPFACLPNHVVGKGVIKALKKTYPESNIAAVDYDPGASEVNQLNRIKLILSSAKETLK